MNNKRKVLIFSAILVGLGGFYIYKNMKMKSPEVDTIVPKETLDRNKILSKGSTGEEVKLLQKALKGGLVIDGDFGALTERRLKAVTGKTSISINDYDKIIIEKTKK
jgi:hypothetical protein